MSAKAPQLSASLRRFIAAALLCGLSLMLLALANANEDFADFYARSLYPLWVSSLGGFSGLFPLSLSEIGLYAFIAVLALSLIRCIVKTLKKGAALKRMLSWTSRTVLVLSILFLLYTANCGINYHRQSFSETESLACIEYRTEDLAKVCRMLGEAVNDLADDVERDENHIMLSRGDENSAAVQIMESLGGRFESLSGNYSQAKGLVFSELLSQAGIAGIYSPFTIEANYNADMCACCIPFTICHELSHLKGFMQEQEADFIAFLACIYSEDAAFMYSGYLSAWIKCANALYNADMCAWQEVRSLLCEGANADISANNAFWESYEGPVSQTSETINDSYLKANGQSEGIESYGRMVDLVVSYYLTTPDK